MRKIFLIFNIVLKCLIFLFLIIATFALLFKFLNREIAILVLEYLKVLIWPFVVMWFLFFYKTNIRKFIDRLLEVSFPGGKLKMATEQKEAQIDSKEKEKSVEVIKEQSEALKAIEEKYKKEIAGWEAMHSNAQKTIKNLINDISIKDLHLDFERIYNVIFGSQIDLLRHLIINKKEFGETRLFIESFYEQVKQKFRPVFDLWSVDNYLSYLIVKDLIVVSSGMYKITVKGTSFISYITYLGYAPKGL